MALLHCLSCNELFRNRALLNNHVRSVHQATVQVRFQNGKLKEIQRGRDGSFTCDCGKVFKHPISLRRHGKQCVGAELENDVHSAENTSLLEDSMNEDEVGEAEEMGDCTGICLTRMY